MLDMTIEEFLDSKPDVKLVNKPIVMFNPRYRAVVCTDYISNACEDYLFVVADLQEGRITTTRVYDWMLLMSPHDMHDKFIDPMISALAGC